MKKIKKTLKISSSKVHQLFLSLIALQFIHSCAFVRKTMSKEDMLTKPVSNKAFILTDKSGKFNYLREAGYQKQGNQFVVKRKITAQDDPSKVLEKSIVIATPGKYNGVNLLRPKVSQYTVWFEKKKYFTEMKVLPKEKSVYVKTVSPEKQWNGEAKIKFPKMTGVYCFFSQVLDCAKYSGFINEATKRQAGSMKLVIIWEGYPFFQEQYLNIPDEIFTNASLEYEGKNRVGERRFTLKFQNQQIFYFLGQRNTFKKSFWVQQGMSVVPNPIQPK